MKMNWFLRLLARLTFSEVITGTADSVYLWRWPLTPMTPWGQLLLHRFWRGDEDPDPHDHPWDFWTFPLWDYVEQVLQSNGEITYKHLTAFRWHRRSRSHIHRVMPELNKFPFTTLVWRRPPVPGLTWGFWIDCRDHKNDEFEDLVGWYYQSNPVIGKHYMKVPWRTYLFREPQKDYI